MDRTRSYKTNEKVYKKSNLNKAKENMRRMKGNRKGSIGELRRPSKDCRDNRPAGLAGSSTNTWATSGWSSGAVRFARGRGWRGMWLCSPQAGSWGSPRAGRFVRRLVARALSACEEGWCDPNRVV